MNMRQLRYFVQIVDSGSLTKASQQLFVAQPALSQQMASLEDEVGKPLLIRSSRGVKPTENGKALYYHAKFMLRQLEQAVAVAQQESISLTGRVVVGLAPTTARTLGLALMEHMRSKYPGIMLNIVEALSGHLEQMTHANQLDLSILFTIGIASDWTVEPLLEEELFVIVPARSKLVPANRDSLTLREISDLPLVLPSLRHARRRRRIELEFERAGLRLNAIAEIDSLALLMAYVENYPAVTIQPKAATLALGSQQNRWRFVRIAGVQVTRPAYLYSLPQSMLSPCAFAVRDELRALATQLVQSGGWQGARLLDPVDGSRI